MWSRLLSDDPHRQVRVFMEFDEEAPDIPIFRSEAYGWRGIIELNKEYTKENVRNIHAGNTQKHMVKIGEIPNLVWRWLEDQGIAQDKRALRRWLNDPDNKYFKTYQGRV